MSLPMPHESQVPLPPLVQPGLPGPLADLQKAVADLSNFRHRLVARCRTNDRLATATVHRAISPSQLSSYSAALQSVIVELTPLQQPAFARLKQLIVQHLLAFSAQLPVDSRSLQKEMLRGPAAQDVLQHLVALGTLRAAPFDAAVWSLAAASIVAGEQLLLGGRSCMVVLRIFQDKALEHSTGDAVHKDLAAMAAAHSTRVVPPPQPPPRPPPVPPPSAPALAGMSDVLPPPYPPRGKRVREEGGDASTGAEDLQGMLTKKSFLSRQEDETTGELAGLLQKPSALEAAHAEQFKSFGGPAVKDYCEHLTKQDCCQASNSPVPCNKTHFRRLIFEWTDPSKGNCPFLDTCKTMTRSYNPCRAVHYELDDHVGWAPAMPKRVPQYLQALDEPQWINCDIQSFDMSLLGKFGVVMADPPWDIHMELPYGTMSDDEMRKMNIGCLQDEGVIFLWVTTRAMELGQECLHLWGYEKVDELIWVKTNQLKQLIRTGRTGHWLNHTKEHCLVGVKGKCNVNRRLDCDVLVAEVRETSRKPDEMYSLLERLSPGTRKIEIFARPHNCRPGWISLGNQLDGVNIKDPELRQKYVARYGAAMLKDAPSR